MPLRPRRARLSRALESAVAFWLRGVARYGLPIIVLGLASSPLQAQGAPERSPDDYAGPAVPIEWTGETTASRSEADNPDVGDPNVDDPYDIIDEGWEPLKIGPVRVGGAFRVNYIYKDWDEAYQGLVSWPSTPRGSISTWTMQAR